MNKNDFLIELAQSARTDFGRRAFSLQSEPQKVFSSIWALESQVNNGGFLQYFGSDDGDTASFAPTALRHIGAVHCAIIVEQAIRIASAEPLPDSRGERQLILQSLKEPALAKLGELDEQFFAYPDNLTELLYSYVRAHPEVFGPVK